jgi:hypothetical protein
MDPDKIPENYGYWVGRLARELQAGKLTLPEFADALHSLPMPSFYFSGLAKQWRIKHPRPYPPLPPDLEAGASKDWDAQFSAFLAESEGMSAAGFYDKLDAISRANDAKWYLPWQKLHDALRSLPDDGARPTH